MLGAEGFTGHRNLFSSCKINSGFFFYFCSFFCIFMLCFYFWAIKVTLYTKYLIRYNVDARGSERSLSSPLSPGTEDGSGLGMNPRLTRQRIVIQFWLKIFLVKVRLEDREGDGRITLRRRHVLERREVDGPDSRSCPVVWY
jgi:hypothetical protein